MKFDQAIDRKGTFCTQWDFVQDRFGVPGLLPFTISDTDFAVPDEVTKVLKERLEHPVFGYTRWNHNAFKNSVIYWYKYRLKTQISGEWIQYSPSVIYSISVLIQLMSSENSGIVLQTPAYDAFFKVIKENNRKVVENPLYYNGDRYDIDFADLEEKLAKSQNEILLLCSPHNPTGRVWTKKELESIVALCQKYSVFLIVDEIHMDVLRKGVKHYPIVSITQKNVASASSGTKTFNFPSLIFSYILLPDESLREKFQGVLKGRDGLSSASIMGMLATMTAYQKCENWVDELNDYLDQNISYVTEFLQNELPQIKVVDSQATYLMWLDVSALDFPMEQLQNALIHVGKVAIMDGKVYGGNGNHFLRLNVGCPRTKVIEGLKRLKQGIYSLNK
ncbi:pyridoxal phosphate-dependent aminotransferase [Tetragenococcus osmophilus]|uniref:cysteine-S-conjugate beta-lyase n=1 Tax=Tetragenococcus osmophilus TaxID=526944 RepID=A0AA37XMX8_9ENTE|nr:MalY/PatB family protein [Tetragenococcus osmophilus]AYW47313.1 pyridoxal phosphate-dependent aminotransferase [Tetragenococcus osmophilus]GMA52848.1 aminotransferase [Alicyclobacillus contaminans]GMA73155.1 aminotransferase [Tetragenococcus osmophilus]